MRLSTVIHIVLSGAISLAAQVVTSQPPYPTISDSIVIIFNAAEGSQGLMGYTGTDVYAHTGLITNLSATDTDWRYVKTNWLENTPETKMTKIGTDLWQLTIGFIDTYYGINLNQETVKKLAFVFRNSTGTKEGKDVGNTDIFLKIYDPGISAVLVEPDVSILYEIPERSPAFIAPDSVLKIVGTAAVVETGLAFLSLSMNNEELAFTASDDTLVYALDASAYDPGMKTLYLAAGDTTGIIDSLRFNIMINPIVVEETRPENITDGISYIDDHTVTLSLFAPYKTFVYIIGDFNDWNVDPDYFMKRQTLDEDNVVYWLRLAGLTPGQEYAFQYLVDGQIRIADPYADKILDPWNDPYISKTTTYPGLKPYPAKKTSEIVSVFQTGRVPYTWEIPEFERPDSEDLVIYELLIRDFIAAHDYKTLIDTLDYLGNLGINAIELMPVNEFEGNESWGYNPSFYFAPDKYYGPADDLKRFIDECHKRGMAVILDMVLNHSFGQSPFVRLYNEGDYGKPLPENPWYNVTAPHEFSWGYDFNHESESTQALVDRINRYWLEEYKIDGYRFDFTKGFTNKSGSGWEYDASRVAIIKRMADQLWAISPGAYIILEHWTTNSEEDALSDYGAMLWGHANQNAEWGYYEAAMGYHDSGKSDFSWGYYKTRGWEAPHLVTYMESHDEERVMFKNREYGNASGGYNIKDLPTALNRMKMAAAFFLTIPGPKMIWQFGELGYDYSIDYNGRVGNKPIRWDYLDDENRLKLYKTFSALIKMRKDYSTFRDPATFVELDVANETKRIKLQHWYMKVVVVGNFGVVPRSMDPSFHTDLVPRWWYDFFSGDSIYVTDVHAPLQLEPGEFHILTTVRLDPPEEGLLTGLDQTEKPVTVLPFHFELKQNFPNPFNPETTIELTIAQYGPVDLAVYNLLGQKVKTLLHGEMKPGRYQIRWDGTNDARAPVASGVYIYRLNNRDYSAARKLVLMR